jgi:hypothetical protein
MVAGILILNVEKSLQESLVLPHLEPVVLALALMLLCLATASSARGRPVA